MATLREWLSAASAEEKRYMAELCNTSVTYLYQLANPAVVRSPSLAMGLKLHRASVALRRSNPDLPEIGLDDLINRG